MQTTVVINMQNPNALIAMALVSQNSNNPYATFCEYIKYCIFVDVADTLTLSEVKEAVSKEFGLHIPHNIMLNCLSHIQNEGIVSWDNHQIKRIGNFDTETFEQGRTNYRITESALIDELVKYAAKFNRVWTVEFAREQLIGVLDRNGLAYDIFIHKQTRQGDSLVPDVDTIKIDEMLPDDEDTEIEDTEKKQLYTDSFFVGKFVEETLSSDSIYKDYLQRICEGLMLCVGAYQLPVADMESVRSQIKGTGFFFDTRLLLRFIGCAGEAAVESAKELVKLIQDAGGNIYYYPQTLEEMNRAFDEAIQSLSYGYPPRDEEMRLYAARIKNRVTIISSKKANLKEELSASNIYIRQHEIFSDSDRIRFGFEQNDLQQYMQNHLSWDLKTIENDAMSIWETHMRRQGDYSEYCGTNARLPIFVTTNSRLIGIALKFREERAGLRCISGWKQNRLPIITDMRLTCRLWSPATQGERLSLLYLTANAVAAQRPTQHYLNTVRELAVELENNVPEYSGICLPAFFDENVTNIVLERTHGLEENLNIGNFASSIAELSEWKAKEQEEKTNQVIMERDKVSMDFDRQTQSIIEDSVNIYKNKLGIGGITLKLIFYWPVIATLLFAGVSSGVSYVIGNYQLIWVVLFPIILGGIEEFSCSKFVKKRLLKYVCPKVEKSFEIRIKKGLRRTELPYEDIIIQKSKEQTTLLVQCKNLLIE